MGVDTKEKTTPKTMVGKETKRWNGKRGANERGRHIKDIKGKVETE